MNNDYSLQNKIQGQNKIQLFVIQIKIKKKRVDFRQALHNIIVISFAYTY